MLDAQPTQSVRTLCPYCGVGCGMVLEVAAGRVTRVTGDKSHPANFGRLCTKGTTSAEALRESGRMETAYFRRQRKGEAVAASISAAISETARRLRALLDQHGPDAISFYVSGQMSMEAQYLANKLAKGFIGTNNIESNSRLCMASAGSGYKLSLGADGPPGSYQDFDHADVFFVIGANMADCHPILFLRMMNRVRAGAKLIVVDPRHTATADKASLFLQIKPGTDLALLNGLLHLIVKNGHADQQFIAEFTEGWEAMPAFLADYSPARVAAITGLAEADIRTAAEWIGQAPECMSCWTMGLNQSTHGTWNTNSLCNLHLSMGKICRRGSGPFSLTGQPNAMGGREMGYMGSDLPGQRSVLVDEDRAFIEQLWKLPRGRLKSTASSGSVDMFRRLADGDIKACWIICTNPVATMPNRKTVISALEAAELVITQDAFLETETNPYADILLPGALWAEGEGVMVNSERTLTLLQQAIEPPGEALPDWQIIARVACAMGFADAFQYLCASEVFEELKGAWNPQTGYDLRGASYALLRQEPLQWPCAPDAATAEHPIRYLNDGVSQTLKVDANGNRPPLVFATATGKAVFLPRPYVPANEMPNSEFPMVLNTGRLQHQWHTMTKTGKIATLNKLNPGPFVEIHVEDARSLEINDRDAVELRSRRGMAVLPARLTDRVLRDSCFVPFHWNDVFGADLSINAVTNDAVDPISFQPEFKVCAVSLTPVPTIRKLAPVARLLDQLETSASLGSPGAQQINVLAEMLGVDSEPGVRLEADEKTYLGGYLAGLRLDTARSPEQIPVLPLNAPIEETKRLWIDGLLAGMFSRRMASAGESLSAERVVVLWASQTGNAERFAEQCADGLRAGGYEVQLAAMDAFEVAALPGVQSLLLISSTFGDGDAPDSGARFWSALNSSQAPALSHTRYSVLAFGDSTYDQFCGHGRRLDQRLEVLGAQRLVARADCEPDYEHQAAAWLQTVQQRLSQMKEPVGMVITPVPRDVAPIRQKELLFDKTRPLAARLKSNDLLSRPGSAKETRHCVIDLPDARFTYEPGDALGVWPSNCPDLVEELLSVTRLGGEIPVKVAGHGEISLSRALLHYFEIARVSPDFLGFVEARCKSEVLTSLLQQTHKSDLKQWLWGRQITDVLRAFPIVMGAEDLLQALKRLQPRLYSLSSSQKATPHEVQLTVSTVRFERDSRNRKGVCSTFLADRANGIDVPIFVQTSKTFRLPRDSATPIIMVGPGTGIAPFRAFLQERQARGDSGRNWLFFGEQTYAADFYYREELYQWRQDGLLTRLDLAFSRDQAEKIYVQDQMRMQGGELWAWLQDGAHFYVCGDASRMAKDVDHALCEIARVHGGLSREESKSFVERLAAESRYVRDVY